MAEIETDSLISKELEGIIKDEQSGWKREVEKLEAENVDYLNFDDFLNKVQQLEKGMFTSVSSTMQSCVGTSNRNDKRSQVKEINTEAFRQDPWRNMYFASKDIEWHMNNSVIPIYTLMLTLDDVVKEKAYSIIKGYKSVVDSKQEYEYKEKMIDKVSAFSEKQLETSSRKDDERFEKVSKVQRETLERLENLFKSTLTEMRKTNEDSLERLEKHYVELRKRDIELIESIAEKMSFPQSTTLYEDKSKKKRDEKESPVERAMRPETGKSSLQIEDERMAQAYTQQFAQTYVPPQIPQQVQQQMQQQIGTNLGASIAPTTQVSSIDDTIEKLYKSGKTQPLEIAIELKKANMTTPMSQITQKLTVLRTQGKI